MKRLDQKMTIKELLDGYPAAMDVFIRRRMFCVGCPARAYHSLEEAARIYGYEPEALVHILRDVIGPDIS